MVTYVGVAIAGLVALSLLTFWMTVRPPRIAVPGRPEDYGLVAERLAITAGDGVRLVAWLIPRARPPGAGAAERHPAAPPRAPAAGEAAVILLHGYPAEKADMLPIARTLWPHFTTLLVDQRYFGESGGGATTLGHRERDDLKRAIDVLIARGIRRIGVFGYSLGGAVALLAAAEDARIGAVATYAAFADLRVLGEELYAHFWLLRRPFVMAMRGWSALFLGADITRPAPEAAARRLTVPVLLVHNPRDDQIPFGHAERLRAALAGNPHAEFILDGPGRHNDRPPDFDRRLADFFRRSL